MPRCQFTLFCWLSVGVWTESEARAGRLRKDFREPPAIFRVKIRINRRGPGVGRNGTEEPDFNDLLAAELCVRTFVDGPVCRLFGKFAAHARAALVTPARPGRKQPGPVSGNAGLFCWTSGLRPDNGPRPAAVRRMVGVGLDDAGSSKTDRLRWCLCWYRQAAVNRPYAGSIPAAAACTNRELDPRLSLLVRDTWP